MGLSVKKAKEHCGYDPKPVLPVCANCASFRSDLELPAWMVKRNQSGEGVRFGGAGELYTAEKHGIEKNLRCADGGFAVKKMGSCRLWKPKPANPGPSSTGEH